MNWKPLGKFVLVRWHRRGSALDLSSSEVVYNGLATVIAVGAEVVGVSVGDVVMLGQSASLISHKEFGEEDIALVPAPLLLAVREEAQH